MSISVVVPGGAVVSTGGVVEGEASNAYDVVGVV